MASTTASPPGLGRHLAELRVGFQGHIARSKVLLQLCVNRSLLSSAHVDEFRSAMAILESHDVSAFKR